MEQEDWKPAAIAAFFDDGLSYREVAERFGRDISTVRKLIARERDRREAEGIPIPARPKRTGDPRCRANMRKLSPVHGVIGARLNFWRTVQNKKSATEVGALLGCSAQVVGKMEMGAHDFTLSQLFRLADILEVEFDELFEDPRTDVLVPKSEIRCDSL